MNLRPLYKLTKTGAIQQCIITTSGDTFTVQFGQVGGAQQFNNTVCFGTNIGKSNERSPTEQATFEAKAKWASKVKSGYTENPSGEIIVELPMKVKVLQDQEKNVVYPCISTPKLNGVNGTYKLENDELNLYSRGGELYPAIPHLEESIKQIMYHTKSTELNGELYIHGEHLQDITSAVKKPKPLSKRLEFALFDIPSDKQYKDRRDLMITEDNSFDYDYVSFLVGIQCDTRDDIETHYNQCMAGNLEGTVIKNYTGLYTHNVRSSDQFKYKKALDAEFEVINVELDKKGFPVWICTTKTGKHFKAKPKGVAEDRIKTLENVKDRFGTWATVEYEMLSKDGVPLKPVFLAFRNCNEAGEPLE